MITEKDLLEAIEECEKEPITATKIAKLADFYTIYNNLFGAPVNDYGYSYAAEKEPEIIIDIDGDSEFFRAINGKDPYNVWHVINELMDTIKIINPRLYDGVIRRLT